MTQTPAPAPAPLAWTVTAKEHLSAPWATLTFPDPYEAQEFADRAAWVLPDADGREVSPPG